jgi:integrase
MLSAIALAHRAAGESFDRRMFDRLLLGMRRIHGSVPRRVSPLTVGELRTILMGIPETPKGVRDRALLTVGFAGALRRSELVNLDLGPRARGSRGCAWIDAGGMRIVLHSSKTDAIGNGHSRWLPRGGNPCPVEALERWLAISRITQGPIFRAMLRFGSIGANRLSPQFVGSLIKDLVYEGARRAGASEAQAMARAAQFSGHSLRAGFVTSAILAGVSSEEIAAHVGWSTTRLVFAYVREVDPFKGNPAQLVLAA